MRPRVILTVDDSPTIRRVVQLVLAQRGYETHAASDGEEGLRLSEELRPDLILVDVVMPRMNGHQFCRALAERPALRDIPVVLLSARPDQMGQMGQMGQVGERSARGAGIVGHLAKPFSPEALLGAVEQALSRGGGDHTPVELLDAETTDAHSLVVMETEVTATGTIPAAVMAALSEGPAAGELPPERPSDEEVREAVAQAVAGGDAAAAHIAEEVRACLTPRAIARLLSSLRLPRPAASPSSAALAGDLGRVPLCDVLALLAEQGQDGVLEARADAQAVQVCLRGGRVDFVGADGLGEEHRLGSYLVRAQAIGRADLELFFGSRASTARLCGEQLVKLGHVRAEELRAALRRQSAERLYEALRMARGRFELRPLAGDEPLAQRAADAALGLSVPALLLEGGRRIDEWHLLRRDVGDDDAVFLRNEEAIGRLPPDALGRGEQAVLELCNARNTVRDIVRQTRQGPFEIAQLLLRLRTARLIRRRVQPVAV